MAGFTEIYLKNRDRNSIEVANSQLAELKIPKKYHFYTEEEILDEYAYYQKNKSAYPAHLFPHNKIKTYWDFKQYWHPDVVGAVFAPLVGSMTFDCYFDRTSEKNMKLIAKWVQKNIKEISHFCGSYGAFFEKAMTAAQIKEISKYINCDGKVA